MLNELKRAMRESRGEKSDFDLISESLVSPEIADKFLDDDDKGIGKGKPLNIEKLINMIPESDSEALTKDDVVIESLIDLLEETEI